MLNDPIVAAHRGHPIQGLPRMMSEKIKGKPATSPPFFVIPGNAAPSGGLSSWRCEAIQKSPYSSEMGLEN